MTSFSNLRDVLRLIDPDAIGRFLTKQGYTKTGHKEGQLDVFENQSREVILVPLNRERDDYVRQLREIVEIFTNATTAPDDVVGAIVLPDSDIFRYRVETPESTWGHLRLSYTYEAMHALYDLLMFTAAGVSTHRTDYRRISDAAKAFAHQCRFGQTEYGSFVLKVFCPTNPIGVQDSAGEHFGRLTTRAVVENLDFLASERSEDDAEPLPPTLNRQVAIAVHRLNPGVRLGVSTEVEMRYSSTIPREDDGLLLPVAPTLEPAAILDLGPFIFNRAQSVYDRLKKAEEFEREIFRGFITELHKDRPAKAMEQSHEITLEVKYGTNWRNFRVRLLPKQYHDAVRWHDSNYQVDVDGVIDKRSAVWSVWQLKSFKPVDPAETAPRIVRESQRLRIDY